MKYRKKPIIIEAFQWYPTMGKDGYGIKPLNDSQLHAKSGLLLSISNYGMIDTLEGPHIVSPGDWIITGVNGEKYPCKPDIFEKTYEAVISEQPKTNNLVQIDGYK